MNYDKSITIYESLIKERPNNALYHNNLGWVLFKNGDFEKAKEHIELAKKLDSTGELSESIQTNLAMVSVFNPSNDAICKNLKEDGGIAYLVSESDFDVDFKYGAEEIGYLLLGQCFFE